MVQVTDNLSRLIDEIDGRLTIIDYRFGPSRKRQYLFILIGPLDLLDHWDAFSEPMRNCHFWTS